MELINYKSILKCTVLLLTIFIYPNKKSYSQNLRIKATNFNELMRETLATQDAVFEAEKKILSKKQTKKVVEGDYLPSIQSEVIGEYTLFDNFREVPPIDEYELHLSTDWNIYDFGRKNMKYKSADISIDIEKNNLKLVHNKEMARLLKIYTDYSHHFAKMNLINDYEKFLLLMQKEVADRIKGGVGTILEKNQFDQTLNALALRKLDAKKFLQSAKSDYQLYFSTVFNEKLLPKLDDFKQKTKLILENIFNVDVVTPQEIKLKLEISKAVIEKEIYASEYYPDVKVGLKLRKFDLYDNDPDFEIVGSLTNKINLFDGFKREYSVQSKVEEIAGLAAKLRLSKLQKEQRIIRYKIEYDNFVRETENEMIKMSKIKDDFKIAQDMTTLKALNFGEKIKYASDILTSQLKILDNYYQQYNILIDVIDLKGKFTEMFNLQSLQVKGSL